MEHYYSSNPTSKSEERMLEYILLENKYKFVSDNGVFAKDKVDFATDFLLKTIYGEISGDILDVGCGYGVIGITLSKNSEVKSTTMLDVNNRALGLTRKNIELNKVKNVTVIESDGFEKINSKFDCIITNPPIRAGKAVIYKMYEDAKNHLNPNGKLYLVINKKHGAPSTIEYLNNLFGNCEVIDKKAGFHVLRCMKGTTGDGAIGTIIKFIN